MITFKIQAADMGQLENDLMVCGLDLSYELSIQLASDLVDASDDGVIQTKNIPSRMAGLTSSELVPFLVRKGILK